MRPQHTQHPLPSFPVYSCAFLSPNEVVLGGGGGATKSGIKNKLRLYRIQDDRSLTLTDEYELEKGEDAPMSMAAHLETRTIACGVNSVEEKLQKGENENCRTFSFAEAKIQPLSTSNTIPVVPDKDDFQKVTVLSPDGTLLAVAGTNDFTLLSFPSLQPLADTIHIEKDIYDASFSDNSLVITTTQNLLVYKLPEAIISKTTAIASPQKGKKKAKATSNGQSEKLATLELQQSVEVPISKGEGGTFRAGRYQTHNNKVFYTVVNVVPPRSRKAKSASRHAFICKWDTTTWSMERYRRLGDGSLTSMDLSPDGRFIGYGFSDLTIGLLDAKTLSPLASILKAHEFPPTIVKFNLDSSLLVSGSPDNSIRIVTIPHDAGGNSFTSIVVILLAILLLLVAVAVRQYPGGIGL